MTRTETVKQDQRTVNGLEHWLSRRRWWVAGGLFLVTVCVFAWSLSCGFVEYDDNDYVVENEYVRQGLTPETVAWAFRSRTSNNWHPLTMLSHCLDVTLYGMNAWGHHLTSVLLHGMTVVVLWWVLWRYTGCGGLAMVVALLFGVHPLRVESVTWIAERKDVLSGLLFTVTLLAYGRYVGLGASGSGGGRDAKGAGGGGKATRGRGRRSGGRVDSAAAGSGRWGGYLVAVVSFALGLMAKPMLVTLPFVLLLLDAWPLGRSPLGRLGGSMAPLGAVGAGGPLGGRGSGRGERSLDPRSWRGLLLEKVPFFLLSAGSCVVTWWVQSRGGSMSMMERSAGADVGLLGRLANAAVSSVAYLVQMVVPIRMAVFYPHPGMPPLWQWAAAMIVLAGVTVWAIRSWRTRPYRLVGWLWYLGMLVPVIGLVQVGIQARADRYTYLPMIGALLVVVWELAGRWLTVGTDRVAAVGNSQTANRSLVANSSPHANSSPITHGRGTENHSKTADRSEHASGSAIGAGMAGRRSAIIVVAVVVVVLSGMTVRQITFWRDGMSLFTHALAVTEDNYVAWYNLGVIHEDQDEYQAALEQYARALEAFPEYPKALNNSGSVLLDLKQYEQARDYFERAIAHYSEYATAHYNLGIALAELGEPQAAEAAYRRAMQLKPGYAEAMHNLGLLLVEQGRHNEAIGYYRQVLTLNPEHVGAMNNLAIALQETGRSSEAAALYQQALQAGRDDARTWYNLALQSAQQGRAAQAEEHYRKTLAIDPSHAGAWNNLGALLAGQGRFAEAAECFREMTRLQPGDASGQVNYGTALLQAGQMAPARQAFSRALELSPDNATAWFMLGEVERITDRVEQARQAYRQTLIHAPAHPGARQWLKSLTAETP